MRVVCLKETPVQPVAGMCVCVQSEESEARRATRLFLVHFNHVVVLHFQLFGGIRVIDASTVEQKSQRRHWHSLSQTESRSSRQSTRRTRHSGRRQSQSTHHSLRVRLLQLGHRCRHFDPEVDLIRVLTDDFEFDVLRPIRVTGSRFLFL